MPARVAVVVVVLLLASFARADDLPTPDQLQKLADDKNWPDLMKAATRVLQLKGPAAEPYDRPVVWMLKAEAQLQSNMFVAAAESFEDAAKEPNVDPAIADRCVAMSEVMRKTDARGFRPKPPKPGATVDTIDVKDPAKRPDAMKALFASEIGQLRSQLEKQKKDASLGDLVKLARSAEDLPPLERAALGSAEQTKALLTDAGSVLATSVTKWLEQARTQTDRIRESANELVQVEQDKRREGRNDPPVYRKRGLTSKDTSELNAIKRECRRIADAYKAFVDAAGEPGEDLAAVPPRVDAAYAEAQTILDADYSGGRR